MAYGLYKYIVVKERAGATGSQTFQIELWKKDYTGSTEQLEGSGSYFEHDYTSINSANPFKDTLQSSKLSLNFLVEDSSHITLLNDIFSSDEDEYLLKKKVDGTYHWQGKVLNDLLEYSEGDYPSQAKIVAVDLSYLKGVDYTLASGYETIITTIASVLNTLGFSSNIITHTNWVENNQQAVVNDDFLNRVYHDKYGFRIYKKSSDESDKELSQYEVLDRICKNYNLILRQSSNAWYIYHLSALSDPTSVKKYVYNSSGVQQSSSTYDITTSIDSSNLYLLDTSVNKFNPAIKKASVEFEHRTGTNSTIVNASRITSTTTPSLPSAEYSLQFEPAGDELVEFSGRNYAITGRSYYQANDPLPQAPYLLKAGQYYWNNDAGDWQEYSDITTSNSAIQPSEVDTANNKIRIVSNDFFHGDIIRVESGLASGLSTSTEYYLIDVSGTVETGSDTFYYQLSETPDGTPVSLGSKSSENKNIYRVNNREQMATTTPLAFDSTVWWYDFNIITNAIPADTNGDVEFYAMSAVMPARTLFDFEEYAEYASPTNYWVDTSVILKDPTTSNGDSYLYELEQDNVKFSTYLEYPSVYFGDGPVDYSRSALKVTTTTTADTSTYQWDFAGGSTNSDFFEIWLKEVINFQRTARRNIRAELFGTFNGYEVVSYDSKKFFFLGGTHIGNGNTWSADLIEIDIETGTDTFTLYKNSENATGSGGSGGGTSGSVEGIDVTFADGRYLQIENDLSDVDDVSTARTNLGLGTGDSPTFNGLTSTGVIITDEIDTTSIVWDALTPEVFWATSEEKFNNPVYISTSLDVDNGINADQHVYAGTYLKADTYLEVGTSATIGTTLDVGTNATVGGTLDVTGATTLSILDVTSNTTVGGTLSVTGNTTISGTLDASTLNTGQGDNELYAMNQDVQTSDSVTFDALAVTNNASVGGSLTLTGEADFNSTMNLQGNLTTQANLADDGYSPSWSGSNWQIQADGTAEFQELFVRGALTVYEFIAKQISTIGGSEILSIAQGKIDTVTPSSGAISFENTGGAPGISFKAGDLWICQVTSINQDKQSGGSGVIVKSVTGQVSFTSGNSIITSVTSGSLNDLAKGDLIVVYGNAGTDANAKARQAIMYRNVDRSVDSLIMRMQTGIDEFSKLQDEANTRVAFGDLGPRPSNSTGYSGLTEETFGFFAGDNSAEHILVTEGGLSLKDGSITLAELSAGTFKVGDDTNFISFDNSNLDITTSTFSLDTASIHIDSSTLGGQIKVGSGDEVILGNLSSIERGLSLNSNNYWKFNSLTSGYFFKVGDATNFISFNDGGNLNVKTNTFTLDTTTDGNGIKIESENQRIQFEDESRVRTQVDVNDGGFSLTETVHDTNDEDAVVNQGTEYTRDEIPQITKGDSILIDVSANCTSLGTSGTEAYYQVLVYGGTTSGNETNLISTFLSNLITTTSSPDNNATAVFSVYSYDYDYIKVEINVLSNSTPPNAQFTLDQDIIMKSYNSQTRVSLDGVFVNNSDTQFAKLTRSENELGGIIKFTNLPNVKPNQTGIVYKDSNGFLKIS
jgi:hypothetical protein